MSAPQYSRFCFFLPPGVNKKVVQQVLSASLPFFPRNSVAKGVTAYFPGMRPCFDLNFPVLCCLVVQPSSVAPLTGLLENRTPFFFFVLIPREEEAPQFPTDFGSVGTDCLTLFA